MGKCFNNFNALENQITKKLFSLITTILIYYKYDVENTKILVPV